jgi:SAM-dependent methyltransferase
MGATMDAAEWDARYAQAVGSLFGEAPNLWLRMAMARIDPPRDALLPADGDGRNGAWLAAQGVAVTAVDLSAEATRRAQARDAAAGVRAERIVADLAQWTPPPGRAWDLAAILYLQGPPDLRLRALRTAAGALRPGGWLVLEGFAVGAGPVPATVGPSADDRRYAVAETLAAVAGLQPVELMTGTVMLDEGPRHRGAAHVLRLLARRP